MSEIYGWKYFMKNEKEFKRLQHYWFDRGWMWCSGDTKLCTYNDIIKECGGGDVYWLYVNKEDKKFFCRMKEDGEGGNDRYYELRTLNIVPKELFEL